MQLETVPEGLAIQEGPERFVLVLHESEAPIEELAVRAALGVVLAGPPSDGKLRAQEILVQGDEAAVRLGVQICAEFIARRARG